MKKRDAVIETARAQIGYRAVPGVGTSVFGSWAGHPQGRWDGAFLDWCADQVDVDLPRMTDTNWAMHEYVRTGRLYLKPRVGDIAFMYSNVQFGMPRVGIVTAVSAYGNPTIIAGESANPQPQSNNDPIGVYESLTFNWRVIGYGRPRYRRASQPQMPDTSMEVRTSDIQWQKKNRKVQAVQMALADTIGADDMTRGVFDTATREWYAQWQRNCGQVTPDGTPDDTSLQRLGAVSGLFTWREL
jgi:hypothetical protein